MASESAAPVLTERRELGKSGIKVSPLALGSWQFGDPTGTYTKQSADTEAAIVRNAWEAGINFFDTAEGYGARESERALGVALRGLGVDRSEYVLATKINNTNCSGSKIAEACDRSLANLGMEYVDLYQVHWPAHDIDLKDTLGGLKALQDAGKIKAVGVSNFGVGDLGDALTAAGELGLNVVSNQLPYGLLMRQIEHEILPLCAARDVGVMAYSPLAQGLLTGKYASADDCPDALSRSRFFDCKRSKMARHTEAGCEAELFAAIEGVRKVAAGLGKPMSQVALSWAVQQPHVTSVVFGASKPEHVLSNALAASEAERLDEATLAALAAATDDVKTKLGTNPDLWDDASVGRYR